MMDSFLPVVELEIKDSYIFLSVIILSRETTPIPILTPWLEVIFLLSSDSSRLRMKRKAAANPVIIPASPPIRKTVVFQFLLSGMFPPNGAIIYEKWK